MKKEKKVNWTLIIILALVLGFIAYIGRPVDAPESVVSKPVVVESIDDLDKEFKSSFMEGCMEDGTNARYCSCVYDSLTDNFTVGTIIDLAIEGDEEMSWMNPYIEACL